MQVLISDAVKPAELDALAEGVRPENYRIHALEAQSQYALTFPDLS